MVNGKIKCRRTILNIFSVVYVTMLTFQMTILMNKWKILSWMMAEFIDWPKSYLLLSATCDEILSWMIEIWMKNYLVSDSSCNNVIL